MNLYIDYGGTNFRYTYSEDLSEISTLDSKTIDLKKFLDEEIPKRKDLDFIGISIAGQVQNGVIISAPNIQIKNFDVKNYVEENYNIKLQIDNDLNCATLAEFSCNDTNSLAVFYIGTGFGSGFIDNKHLVKGANNISGEIGHIPFKKTPFICGCGRDDCLELSVSGSGLKKWCNHFEINLGYYSLENIKKLDDKNAKKIVENFYKGLSHGFHTALNLFDPDTFVFGGGIVKNNPEILDFIKKEFKNSSFDSLRKNDRIETIFKLSTLSEGSLSGAKILNH